MGCPFSTFKGLDMVFNYCYVYIWTDASGKFRSKVKAVQSTSVVAEEPPVWNYDGSSTGQATTENSEINLVPVACYCDKSYTYVLCATYHTDGTPTVSNTYHLVSSDATKLWITNSGLRIAFEQEFFIYDAATNLPFRYALWSGDKQGEYYCSVGVTGNGFIERHVAEVFERAMNLGLRVTGYNTEVAPAQGEIQIDAQALRSPHDLMMLRYLLWDVLGKSGLYPVFEPKPLGPSWNGSGLHANISTLATMSKGGYDVIQKILLALTVEHVHWMPKLGLGNTARLTGIHETSAYDKFTWGVGSRAASVRVPYATAAGGAGYFEDRRPAANADPYVIVWLYTQLLMGM